jgi:hypothetical protein
MTRVFKNLIRVTAMVSLGSALAQAQQTSAPPAQVSAPTNSLGPKIQFATPLHDFGRVKAGEPVKYTYVFTNTGNALLVINNVQPQCGCTAAGEWTRQVEPGKSGSIPIQFNTMGYNGSVFKQVTVTCNVTNQPMLFLQLKGTVFRPFEVIPPLAVLNVSPDMDTASAVMTVTNHTDDPLILTSAECNNRMFSVQFTTNELGKGYQLTVSAVPPLSAGSVQGQITLKTTWTNNPVIPVTVVANVQPAVMAIPSYVTLAPGPLPNAVTNSVAIQNNSTNLLKLSDPTVNVPGVAARIKENQPGRSFTAMLEFPQGFEIPPGRPVEMSVKTSNPKFPTVTVHVMQLPHPRQPVQPAPPAPAATHASIATPVPAQVQSPPAPAPAKPVPTRVFKPGSIPVRKPPPLPPISPVRAK